MRPTHLGLPCAVAVERKAKAIKRTRQSKTALAMLAVVTCVYGMTATPRAMSAPPAPPPPPSVPASTRTLPPTVHFTRTTPGAAADVSQINCGVSLTDPEGFFVVGTVWPGVRTTAGGVCNAAQVSMTLLVVQHATGPGGTAGFGESLVKPSVSATAKSAVCFNGQYYASMSYLFVAPLGYEPPALSGVYANPVVYIDCNKIT
jgi:hypothetical protein